MKKLSENQVANFMEVCDIIRNNTAEETARIIGESVGEVALRAITEGPTIFDAVDKSMEKIMPETTAFQKEIGSLLVLIAMGAAACGRYQEIVDNR